MSLSYCNELHATDVGINTKNIDNLLQQDQSYRCN